MYKHILPPLHRSPQKARFPLCPLEPMMDNGQGAACHMHLSPRPGLSESETQTFSIYMGLSICHIVLYSLFLTLQIKQILHRWDANSLNRIVSLFQ